MKIKTQWRILVLFCLSLGAVVPMRAATFTVNVSDFAFSPSPVTISVGDSVMWMNLDGFGHTTTSDSGLWDGGLPSGGSFTHTFNDAGTFPYHCSPHPFMTGSVVVQGAPAAPPTGVGITSPADNTTLASPGSVQIQATATPVGSGVQITKVEFYDGANLLATDISSPYAVTVNLGAGQHSLTVKATDSNEASSTSAIIHVTVNGGGTPIADPIPGPIPKGAFIELQTVVGGLISPLGLAAPNDGSGRLFVYDQAGLIYVVTNGVKMDAPLLDVRGRLVALSPGYDERGLLGVALHPAFQENGRIYTYTSEPVSGMADLMIMYPDATVNNHQSVITEWRISSGNTNVVDPTSRREVLRIDKPQSNHNGGTMRFGPDGNLYIVVGDGGAGDDEGPGHSVGGNGQDKTKALGKVLRIDVNGRTSPNGKYSIPLDNPFIDEVGAVKEIYAYGLRNPFAFSFDKLNGELWLGDVGQNKVEEVDKISKGGNYGWPVKEGSFYFDPNGSGAGFVTTAPVREVPPNLVEPVAQYDHDEGLAIIGGFVYRGTAFPNLAGKYVFGDWGKSASPGGRLFYLDAGVVKEFRIGFTSRALGAWLKGFGEDQSGELYACVAVNTGPSGATGQILKLIPATFSISQVSRQGDTLSITWNGGVGPFVIEKKTSVTATQWDEVKTVAETTTTVPIGEDAAFFRVRAQ